MAATFTLDIPNRRIVTDGSCTIQEINDAARDFEDLPDVMALDNWPPGSAVDGILITNGKDDLGAGILSPIILKLVNNWRLYHLPLPGPTWEQVSVTGGTLIATNAYLDSPVENSAYVNWKIPVAQAGALLNIDDLLRLRQWMTNRQEIDENSADNFVLYDDDGVTVKEIQTVVDKDGLPVQLPPGAPAKRSTSIIQP